MKKSYLKNKLKILDFLINQINPNEFKYLPRWVVLFIDVFICLIAIVISGLVSEMDLLLKHVETNEFIITAIIILINLIFFIGLKTYSGLIRHSNHVDAIKLFLAAFGTLIVSMSINYGYSFQHIKFLVPRSYLIIYFLISFSLLFLFRVIVRQIFEAYLRGSKKQEKIKVIILGTESNAVSIASALKSETPSRFKVLGFIDRDKKNVGKSILGLPIIFSTKKASVILRSKGAEGIIISEKSISRKEKNIIVDDCLEFGYKVFRAPLVSNIEDENVSNKIESLQIEDLLERKPIVLDKKAISREIKDKKVLVTGGAGSIGSEIARQIALYKPKTLYVLDQAETPLHNIQLELKSKYPDLEFKTVLADVRNKDRMKEVFERFMPDIVYHAAAYKHVPLMEENPCEAIFVNVLGTKNVADLSIAFGVKKFVMVSTDKAVNPSNIMGASKRIAEMYVQSLYLTLNKQKESLTKFITTRFGNVLGSNGSVVPLFKEQIAKGGPVTITHPDIIRYFMTIPEACQLVLEAGMMGKGGEIFIFDMGDAVKIMDLAKKMIRLAGYTPDEEIKIKITGLRPGEKLYEELLSNKATTLPTHHDKIMIGKETIEDFSYVDEAVNEIINNAKQHIINEMVKKMKYLVPEYKSKNSNYEIFDIEGTVEENKIA